MHGFKGKETAISTVMSSAPAYKQPVSSQPSARNNTHLPWIQVTSMPSSPFAAIPLALTAWYASPICLNETSAVPCFRLFRDSTMDSVSTRPNGESKSAMALGVMSSGYFLSGHLSRTSVSSRVPTELNMRHTKETYPVPWPGPGPPALASSPAVSCPQL